MLRSLWQNPLSRFLITAFLLFIAWFVGYELIIHPWGVLDNAVIDNLSFMGNSILDAMGYDMHPEYEQDKGYRTVIIDGSHGIWIGDPCNGLELFALFTGFIIAFPGLLKKKLIFVPIGLVAIHLMNLVRVISLAILALKAPDTFQFNHTYTFTMLVYGFVFLLWYIWAVKLSGVVIKPESESA